MNNGMGIGLRDVLLALAFIALYFLPTIRAMQVGHRKSTAIVLLNLLAGWLVVPWIIALVWSFKNPRA